MIFANCTTWTIQRIQDHKPVYLVAKWSPSRSLDNGHSSQASAPFIDMRNVVCAGPLCRPFGSFPLLFPFLIWFEYSSAFGTPANRGRLTVSSQHRAEALAFHQMEMREPNPPCRSTPRTPGCSGPSALTSPLRIPPSKKNVVAPNRSAHKTRERIANGYEHERTKRINTEDTP